MTRIPILICLLLCIACHHPQEVKPLPSDPDILHANQDLLTEVIIYDVFTPPVASRIYVYSSLASYEAIRFSKKGMSSIAEKLHGFEKMPQPLANQSYNYT